MKHHLLGLAILAVTASVTVSSSAYAQTAKENERTTSTSAEQNNVSSSVGTILLNSESSFQDVVAVNANGRLATHRFELKLPEGATLHAALPSDAGKTIMLGEVFVQDKQGQVIGVIDAAWAQDANGQPLLTYFTIDGQTLVQTVDTSKAAEQSATVTLTYTGSTSQVSAEAGASTRAYVGIPSNYVYNPRLGSLHDYCTSSPDSFGSANFRGPCARHDMCYQAHTAGKRNCDNWLRTDLRSNCEVAYAWYNPVRATCYNTANIYWAAVTAFGGY